MPDRMRIVGDELVLYDACKNCADRASDLQVIQCNASNVHGSQFIDAYINVLRKSSAVVSQPTLTNLDSPNPKRVPWTRVWAIGQPSDALRCTSRCTRWYKTTNNHIGCRLGIASSQLIHPNNMKSVYFSGLYFESQHFCVDIQLFKQSHIFHHWNPSRCSNTVDRLWSPFPQITWIFYTANLIIQFILTCLIPFSLLCPFFVNIIFFIFLVFLSYLMFLCTVQLLN